MSVVYIVFPLALLIGAVAVAAFVWAVRSGQFDDLKTPALRALHDEDEPEPGGGKLKTERRRPRGPGRRRRAR